MSHRNNPARDSVRPRRRSPAAQAARAAVATLLATLALGGAAPTTSPASGPTTINWDQRITAALLETGTIDPIADELARLPADAPGVLRARARAAEEAGDLATALSALQEQAAQSTLGELAGVQEMLGSTVAAERTLRAAVAAASEPAAARTLTLRLSAMLYDDGRTDDATAALDALVRSDRAAAVPAGVVAYLYGQWVAAAGDLGSADAPTVGIRLLQGTAALKAGRTEAATAAFQAAADRAARPADRRYAADRLVAAARRAGTLPQLADAWLAQPDLPAERMLPLAAVLRELGRVPDLLRWWRAAAVDPARAPTARSDRFVHEVLGAAQSAGRADDVVAICRDMLGRNPDDRQWLTATARALLDQGKATGADALLTSRLDAAADRPADLQALGKLAASLGRDAVALDAGRRLAPFGGDATIAGLLLAASVYRSAGDAPRLADVLQQATAAADRHPAAAGEVVDALEAADLQPQAVRLLTQTAAREPTDTVALDHLASLLIDMRRPTEAVPVLARLVWSRDASTATRSQAARQLVTAAEQAGTLPDLIAATRDRLDRGTGDGQDLSLLVDADLRTKDLEGAADAIRTSKLLQEPERLRRLAVLFLRAKDLGRAEPVLRQLVAADPADAVDTLERLASVALAHGDSAAATAAVHQIEQRVGTGPASLGVLGGVLDRLGRPADAARCYRRAVSADPSDGDAWLLWANAASNAGQAARARQRLLVLCQRADTDDLFVAAVDGLLNLHAPPQMLAAARRAAIVRAAARPERTELYHVVADLSEELRDPATQMRAAEVTVAVSGDERPERLAELMDLASQTGRVDAAVDCGQSLLSSGDAFSPQLFLELGEQLLIDGRPDEAMRAFSRASDASDADAVARRAGALLDRYGYPAAAAAVLSPVASRQANDASLAETLARLDEVIGRDGPAFDQYLSSMRVALRALPTDPDVDDALRPALAPSSQAVHLNRLMDGATVTGRTAGRRSALIDLLWAQLRERLSAAAGSPTPTSDVVAVAGALRRLGIATARPDLADAADAAVLARWPDAAAYAAMATDERFRNDLVTWAERFGADHHVEPSPDLRRARQLTEARPTTLPATCPLDRAAELLPPLIVRGDLDAARRLLAGIPPVPPPMSDGRPATVPVQTVVAAASVLGEPELATRWSLLWLEAIDPSGTRGRSPPAASPAATAATLERRRGHGGPANVPPAFAAAQRYAAAINGTWRLLSTDGRAQFVDRLARQAGRSTDRGVRAALSSDALQLAAGLPTTRRDTVRLAIDNLATASTLDVSAAAQRAFALVPADDRPDVLTRTCQGLPANRRLSFLLTAVAEASDPFDAATAAALVTAAGQTSGEQSIDPTDWFYNGNQRAVLPALAAAALRCPPTAGGTGGPDPAWLTFAAVASGVAGDQRRADDLAARAIAELKALPRTPADVAAPAMAAGRSRVTTPPPDRPALLRTAVSALSAGARSRMVAEVEAAAVASPSSDAGECAVRAVLLEGVGRRSAALDVLRAGFARYPTDADLRRLYAERLQDDARLAELVAAIGPRLGTGDDSAAVQAVVDRSLQGLFRWREVRNHAAGQTPATDLATPAAAGDLDGMATVLRAMLEAARASHGSIHAAPAPDAGGLACAAVPDEPPAALDAVARWPGALDGVMATLQVPLDPSGNDHDRSADAALNWSATLVARAARDPDVRRQVVDRLQGAAAVDMLTRGDRRLVMDLAVLPGVDLPRPLVEALVPAALCNESGVELRRLTAALSAQHAPGADGVSRWADALVRSTASSPGPGTPPAEPTPLGMLDDASVAAWLSSAFATDPAVGERSLAALRAHGRVTPRFAGCALLWARFAAERGDVPTFGARLDTALQAQAWQRVVPHWGLVPRNTPCTDITFGLPATVGDPARRTAILNAVASSLSDVAARWPADTDVVRQLSAVGRWAARQGDGDAARTMLDRAANLADRQGPGEHQLWVADLARAVGQDQRADALELGLLAERCLPSVRIAPILRRLQQQGQGDVALRLAQAAAEYCREPNLWALAGRRGTNR